MKLFTQLRGGQSGWAVQFFHPVSREWVSWTPELSLLVEIINFTEENPLIPNPDQEDWIILRAAQALIDVHRLFQIAPMGVATGFSFTGFIPPGTGHNPKGHEQDITMVRFFSSTRLIEIHVIVPNNSGKPATTITVYNRNTNTKYLIGTIHNFR